MWSRLFNFFGGACLAATIFLVTEWPVEQLSMTTASEICDSNNENVAVVARAAYAYDIATGETLFKKESDMQLPLASLTKVMTALTASSILGPDATVRISEEALRAEGEYGFSAGEKWTVRDLTALMLVASSNDAARALALASAEKTGGGLETFYNAMNKRARAIGLTQTYFLNETGLDESRYTAGAYGSAEDVAHMMAYAAREESVIGMSVVPKETFFSLSGAKHTVANTSLVASTLAASAASKTGYTDLAGGNLAIVFEPVLGHPVSVAVLGSTRESRDTDVEAIASYVTKALKRDIVCNGGI